MVHAKKGLGQNFLRDSSVIKDIADSLHPRECEVIVEIGSGTGNITAELAKISGRVVSTEFDRDLLPLLQKRFKNSKNVAIVPGNVLDTIPNIVKGLGNADYKIVGSIPYNITSPLLHKIALLEKPPALTLLVVQYEVARRICSNPPRATYLSTLVSILGNAKIVSMIPPEAFIPKPKVISALIEIKRGGEGDFSGVDVALFLKFLRKGFRTPRKMLNKVFGREILRKVGIKGTERPAVLTIKEWILLFNSTPENSRNASCF